MKNIILLISLLVLTSCYNDDGEDITYYKFNQEDEVLLIKYDYISNQIITYENQFGEQLHFKVISNERKKRGYYTRGTFSGGGGYLSNYYNSKIIRFEILENSSYEDYSKVNYIFSKNNGTFTNGINFPMWNLVHFGFINEIQDNINIPMIDYNNIEKLQMSINGHLFLNTVIIDSGSNESDSSSAFGSLLQNVNKIYYDFDFGIVQFVDTEGKEWKVIYPE